jgi:hypothetical protein
LLAGDAVLIARVSTQIPCYVTGNFTGKFAILWLSEPVSDQESTVPQRLFAKFPTHGNREIILDNRKFFCVNRESYALTVVPDQTEWMQ